ncbi:AGC family protein kinase [Trichomonas vaginalis G3]|uniref:non-specific serine/threonine protein kinase n=1 Tax=Trichomonas vaginalis (strain ATCC PRA-98 / G3) TaxID=412133 RepID=A2FA91_TRIV3|nr:protein serine/threonine kinase protein [Trichomonas vaginalis G3]EAX98165.1 AGC family protein kinase [Trichomonas vaginalis G3]KAI5515999.1 protein serine/threonine kinase protein [Trichomonas vaginalis G3]|eukprot:XP_001311095.1 AGC family protein kinase [Trichomonas vaginalis G3]
MSTYYKVRKLGQGGFGKVYLIKNSNGKQYALKQIDLSDLSYEMRQKTLSEVVILSHLNNDFIVKHVSSWTEGNNLNIVMDYIDGGNLRELISRQNGRLIGLDRICYIARHIINALQYIHDHHIIHRDLKPDNILCSSSGNNFYLSDFGLARPLTNYSPYAVTQCGTRGYSAPEVLLGYPYNEKADIYSFGLILYELCTLRPFYEGKRGLDSQYALILPCCLQTQMLDHQSIKLTHIHYFL